MAQVVEFGILHRWRHWLVYPAWSVPCLLRLSITLHWRHNDHDGVSNHQPHGCLLNRLFRRRSKKTSKLRVTGLCVGNSPGPVNSPHKGPVTRKMFPFDDVIMSSYGIDLVVREYSGFSLRNPKSAGGFFCQTNFRSCVFSLDVIIQEMLAICNGLVLWMTMSWCFSNMTSATTDQYLNHWWVNSESPVVSMIYVAHCGICIVEWCHRYFN